jgi:hypothetical protein
MFFRSSPNDRNTSGLTLLRRKTSLHRVWSGEENFDCVASQPEVRRPSSGRFSRGEQLGNAAETLQVCRPKRPLAGGTLRNHRAPYTKSVLGRMCNFAHCALSGRLRSGIAGSAHSRAPAARRLEALPLAWSTGRIVTSEECLKHAEECEQLAAMAKLPSNQQALLASATMWRNLAADTKAADGAGKNASAGFGPSS